MNLSHKIRLVPTKTQEGYFRRACGTARFTYNWALQEWKRLYEVGEKPSGAFLKAAFNKIRRERFPWTYEVHRDCTSQPFTNLDKAFRYFFKKTSRYPKFKKRGVHDSFYVANDKFRLDGKRVKLPFLGWAKLREALRFEGRVLGATVSREADAWYLSVQVDVGDYRRERTGNGTVGVDLGVMNLATLSTGEVIEGPKALKRSLRKLQRLSRQHSRKVRGSNNRRKASLRLARYHRRVSNIRNNALHELTSKLCRENQSIGIEDLSVNGMLRNRRLSRAISDMGFGEFRRQLEYKRVIFGADLKVWDRWYPSSKTCSVCGFVKPNLKLSERTFICEVCGAALPRDLNASLNLDPGKLPVVSGEVTPVDRKALAKTRKRVRETILEEAGTSEGEPF